MWNIAKSTGRPLHPSLPDVWDWPYTVAHAVMIRQRYDSYLELPESLPEEHWDFPYLVRRHIERVYPSSKKTQAEVDVSDIEG
jgi:hypothetical protein